MNLFFRRYGVWLLNFLAVAIYAQKDSVFHLTTLTETQVNKAIAPGINLNHCWKYQKGDNTIWADTNFNDRSWKYLNTELDLGKLPAGTFENCGWFRLRISVDSQFLNKPIAFMINHFGTSEIFLDGQRILQYGKIDSNNILNDEVISPSYAPNLITFSGSKEHLIAVRYRNKNALKDFESKIFPSLGFEIKLCSYSRALAYLQNESFFYKAIMVFYFAFFLALAILHFLIFAFYPQSKSNLYYSIFTLFFGNVFLAQALLQITDDPDLIKNILRAGAYIPLFYSFGLLAMLYTIFYGRILKILWVWVGLMVTYLILHELKIPFKILNQILTGFVIIEPLRIVILSIYRKKEGAWILGSGVIATVCFFTATAILIASGHGDFIFNSTGLIALFVSLVVLISTVSIPLSMSAYLARQFAKTNKNLEKKLLEVEQLSAKSIEQEKEKQKILENQNVNLEKQVKERTSEIEHQKKMIEEKQKEMIDSIKYAKRIQQSLLPTAKYIGRIMNKFK